MVPLILGNPQKGLANGKEEKETVPGLAGGGLQGLYVGPRWVFPKIGGTILGVPIIRTIVFWGLYWGPPILGNYQIE